MPSDSLDAAYFSLDILEFIALLQQYRVHYVVVGGEAVIYYGHARLTGDIEFFYDRSPPQCRGIVSSAPGILEWEHSGGDEDG